VLHQPAALRLGKEPKIRIAWVARWAPEPVLTTWRGGKYFLYRELNSDLYSPARNKSLYRMSYSDSLVCGSSKQNVLQLRLIKFTLTCIYSTQSPEYNWATLFLRVVRGYNYGSLALQVGGVSDETIKYGYGFCETRTIE
jgi:hypothetical protein